MTSSELDRALRQILAELELIAAGPCARLDSNTATSDPTGLPTTTGSSADGFRRRLQGIDTSFRRRLDATETLGDTNQRDHAAATAWHWRHQARTSVLNAARAEHARLTGRTGTPPQPRTAKLDTDKGLRDIIEQDAAGKPADDLAIKLGVSKFVVRRIYQERGIDPLTGLEPQKARAGEERRLRAREMADRGMSERQIAFALGCDRKQVRRDLGRAA